MSLFSDALRDQLMPAVERVFFASGFVYTPRGGAPFALEAQFHEQGRDYRFGDVGEAEVTFGKLTVRASDVVSVTRYDVVTFGGKTWEVVRELWRREDMAQLEIQRGVHTDRLAEPDSVRRL